MAEAARVFGKEFIIRHGGTEYKVAPLTLDMLSSFEVWLEDQAFRKVERLKGKVSEEKYRDRLEAVAALVASDAFSHTGALAGQAMKGREAQIFMLAMQLKVNHPEATADLAEAIWEGEAAELQARAAAQDEQEKN